MSNLNQSTGTDEDTKCNGGPNDMKYKWNGVANLYFVYIIVYINDQTTRFSKYEPYLFVL